MIKATPAGIALRLYLCLSTLVVAFISLVSPQSLNGQFIAAAGVWGYVVSWCLILFAFVGISDLVINDLLPSVVEFPFAWRHRQLGYLGIALANVAFIFVMAKTNSLTWLAARYALDGSFCVWVSVMDVVRRAKDADEAKS
jgi:hypothetical protein